MVFASTTIQDSPPRRAAPHRLPSGNSVFAITSDGELTSPSHSDLTDNLLFLDFAITKKLVAFSEKNSQNSSDRFLRWHLVKKIHNRTPELAFGEKKLTTLDRKNQQLPGALKKKPRYLTDKFLAH